MRCLHCGDEYKINMPCPIDIFVAIARAYIRLHRHCPKPKA